MLMKATPGRIVHFYGTVPDNNGIGHGPFAAMVTQVFHDAAGDVTYCNLKVFRPTAADHIVGSVAELGSTHHVEGAHYWEWPPRS